MNLHIGKLSIGKALVAPALALSVVAGGYVGFGDVAAVAISQTAKSLMGARATTSAFTTVTATHNGVNVAPTADAGVADASITPHVTDATTKIRAAAVTAGDYTYSIKFESTAVDDDIPAGTVRARWMVGATEKTASLAVSAAVVGAPDKGGFTLVLPGDAGNTPESIQVVFEQA